MPRMTRAALRSNAALEEDSQFAASVPLPLTPRKGRAPLGEIAGNATEALTTEDNSNDISKPQKKRRIRANRGRATTKAVPELVSADNISVEILEDANQSSTSSAVEEACEDLRKNKDLGNTHSPPNKESAID